jgi:ATP-dependent RNA helicase DOB1
MDDLELFDVFSTDNNPEPVQKTIQGIQKVKPKKEKKEKKDKSKKNSANGDSTNGKRHHDEASSHSTPEIDSVGPTKKRHRKDAENPIIVDSFETESDQILPAAQGLGTAPADHNIIIKKKVLPQL